MKVPATFYIGVHYDHHFWYHGFVQANDHMPAKHIFAVNSTYNLSTSRAAWIDDELIHDLKGLVGLDPDDEMYRIIVHEYRNRDVSPIQHRMETEKWTCQSF